ncbi:MAG TPA: P1 family peptidase [Rectinemataceae bacterium]|nr:P1 family peptidase [Rectinemataceae bacterium]
MSVDTVSFERLEDFRVGHVSDLAGGTGCTVVLCGDGAVAGVAVRGGSPSTRETDALDPAIARKSVHAVLLAGGSAYGLDAAAGVMKYLEERGIGRNVGVGVVPIVCGAVLFDLGCGDPAARPDVAMGYAACEDAARSSASSRYGNADATSHPGSVPCGNVGAGTGATVGKALGRTRAMKGGFGAICLAVDELVVGAILAVNCVGDVVADAAEAGRTLAGVRGETPGSFLNAEACILARRAERRDFFSGENTIIGAVMTNASLTKAEASRLASVAHDGIARAVRPAHTAWDGDTIFALSKGEINADPDAVGILAVRAVELAVRRAVLDAASAFGFPAASDWAAER